MGDSAGTGFERLQRFLASDPDNLELLASVVDAAIGEGAPERALPHIDHALQLAPGHAQFTYRLAVVLRRAGRVDEARKTLESLIATGDVHAVPLHELADLQFQQRNFEACVATAQRIVALPDYRDQTPQADLLLVRALHYLGRLDEAIAHAESVLAQGADRPELRGALATLYLDDDRAADAQQMYEQATQRGQLSPELESVGGYLAFSAEDVSLAERRFAAALARRPDDGRSLLGAGLAAAAQMNLPQAIAQLKQAARSMPTHLGTWNALAWMHIVSGQLDDAQAALEKANVVDHNFAETHGGLAVVAVMKGDAAQARELTRTALKLDRNCFSAAYAAMLLQHGPADRQMMLESAMQFLAKQRTPDGGSLQQAVLRMASRTGRKPATRR